MIVSLAKILRLHAKLLNPQVQKNADMSSISKAILVSSFLTLVSN
jgi:hypothetical protein